MYKVLAVFKSGNLLENSMFFPFTCFCFHLFKAMKRFQKYGLCLDPSKKYSLLDEIGSHFLDLAIELTRQGKSFSIVLDNIDWEIRAHDVRENHQNTSEHAVASSLVFDRVSSEHLPDCGPQKDIKTVDPRIFLLRDDELSEIACHYRIYAARIIVKVFPKLHFISVLLPKHIPHQYSEEMKLKSEVITMPVLMKDEKKYADCVDVMDTFEEWIREIYTKASNGLRNAVPHPPPGARSPIHGPSRPDQPASHAPPVPDPVDPLCGVKVPCIGDQLTRVRFAGAKDLRAGAHTSKDRLDHLYPFRCAGWHTKRSFLKVGLQDSRTKVHGSCSSTDSATSYPLCNHHPLPRPKMK